ncbi:MAG: PadR family transcriptional regulator [Proteobacteria bacterium]|nr:MAG: PadR family transcriptional regulator [Pseudomonadota bacterium]
MDKEEKPLALRGGGLEEATLRAVMHQRGSGYAVTLKPDIEKALGKNLTFGGVYTSLDRLEEKGFIESSWGDATAERGGRRKQFFKVTGLGEMALQQAESAQTRMRQAFAFPSDPLPEGGRS